jgi:hypothetical protein
LRISLWDIVLVNADGINPVRFSGTPESVHKGIEIIPYYDGDPIAKDPALDRG